jgi:hypothetical protein
MEDNSTSYDMKDNGSSYMQENVTSANWIKPNAVWKQSYFIIMMVKIVIFLFMLFGNTLTLVAIAKFESLRTETNCFLASLAVADTLSGIMGIISGLYFFFIQMYQIRCIPKITMVVTNMLTVTFLTSFYHMFLVTLDRFIAINWPLHYHSWITRKVTYYLIASAWIVAFLVSHGSMYWYIGHNICGVNPQAYLYSSLKITISYMLVTLVIGIMYIQIWFIIRKQRRVMDIQINIPQPQPAPPGDTAGSAVATKKEKKSTLSVFVVVVAFVLLWLPGVSHSVLASIGAYNPSYVSRDTLITLYGLSYTLASVNATVNVVIYAVTNKKFKIAFQKLLGCKPKEQLDDSST